MRTFGYLIIVSKHETHNYHRLAHALALSIKKTQPVGYDNVAIVTDDENWMPILRNIWVFDKIQFWNQETHWDGRSWMDQLSPWDDTVCLDADMLFMSDYSHWIDKLRNFTDLYVTNGAYNFRGDKIKSDFYRKTFTKNNLPDLYSAFTFFKKDSDISKEFFKFVRYITKYPTEFKNLLLDVDVGTPIGTDEAFALASKFLGITDQIAFDLGFPRIVHMKANVQDCSLVDENWIRYLKFYLNRAAELKIGNYSQTDIVHYVNKDIITVDEINTYNRINRKRIKDG